MEPEEVTVAPWFLEKMQAKSLWFSSGHSAIEDD